MFILVTVRDLYMNQLIKQVFLGSVLEVFGIFGNKGQVPDVTSSRPASCVTLPTFVVAPVILWNKDVNTKY